jgi:hypothetical protein
MLTMTLTPPASLFGRATQPGADVMIKECVNDGC